jgi:hypothetical protein
MHYMRLWDAGVEHLGSANSYFRAMDGSCPIDLAPGASTDRQLLYLMLKYSDNAATQWFRKRYGNEALNATAAAIGMTATAWHHRIGCADSILAAPNRLTLSDMGMLEEKMQLAQICTAAARDTLNSYFVNQTDDTGLRTYIYAVIDQEATAAGLPAPVAAAYKQAIRFRFKQGGYALVNGGPFWYDRSACGWVFVPSCASDLQSGSSYVFGSFIQAAASSDTSAANRSFHACSEMMRPAIRQALTNCPLAVAPPLVPEGLELAPPAPNPARAGATFRWSLPFASRVQISLVDVSGRLRATLLEAVQPPGPHALVWDGRVQGRTLEAGTYFVRLRAGVTQRAERLTVVH